MIDELRKKLQAEYYEALKEGKFELSDWAPRLYEDFLLRDEAGEIILLSLFEKLHVRQDLYYSGDNSYILGGKPREQSIVFWTYYVVKYLAADEIKTQFIDIGRIFITSTGRERLFKRILHALTKREELKIGELFDAGDVSSLEHDKETGYFSFNLTKDGVDLGRFKVGNE
jgi:hypothetical protein